MRMLAAFGANVDARVGSSTSVNAAVGTTTGTVVGSTVNASLGSAPACRRHRRADVAWTPPCQGPRAGPEAASDPVHHGGRQGMRGRLARAASCPHRRQARVLSPASSWPAPASRWVAVAGRPPAAVKPPAGTATAAAHSVPAVQGASISPAPRSSDKDRDTRITCRSVLASPARYESGLVMLCRKIGQ